MLALLQGYASEIAGEIDPLFWAITLISVVFSVGIFAALIILVMMYRQGKRADRSNAPTHSNLIEVIWTGIPLVLVMGVFVWTAVVYFKIVNPPADSLDIHVVGKQWMWKLQHPSGRWENNELHVPVGRDIKLTLTSEDVIHAFYVPAFRVKQDAIPGQFTSMWFKATKPGQYHLFCAEFCGMDHSRMIGTVYVMEPAQYEEWLQSGRGNQSAVAEGFALYRRNGCGGCHAAGSMVRAPALEGIFGRPVPVQIPPPGTAPDRIASVLKDVPATTVIADARYLHDSILLPDKEVAAGFKPVMPSFKNRLTEVEVLKLVAYIRSLGGAAPPEAARPGYTNGLSRDDYQARQGFVPDNVKKMLGPGGGAAGGTGANAGR